MDSLTRASYDESLQKLKQRDARTEMEDNAATEVDLDDCQFITAATSKQTPSTSTISASSSSSSSASNEVNSMDGVDHYRYSCRCGAHITFTEEQLLDGEIIYSCHGCSLNIRIMFEHDDAHTTEATSLPTAKPVPSTSPVANT
jgi:hypothetical protein